jgi:hypothetical protein
MDGLREGGIETVITVITVKAGRNQDAVRATRFLFLVYPFKKNKKGK